VSWLRKYVPNSSHGIREDNIKLTDSYMPLQIIIFIRVKWLVDLVIYSHESN